MGVSDDKCYSVDVGCSGDAGHPGRVLWQCFGIRLDRAAAPAGLCAAYLSGPRIYLGAWLLGLWRLRLLLGTRRVGAGALHWRALDARVLGLG